MECVIVLFFSYVTHNFEVELNTECHIWIQLQFHNYKFTVPSAVKKIIKYL